MSDDATTITTTVTMDDAEPNLSEFWGMDYMYEVVHKYEPTPNDASLGKRVSTFFTTKDKDDLVIKPALTEDVPLSYFANYNAKIASV